MKYLHEHISRALDITITGFKSVNIDTAYLDARLLLCAATGLSELALITQPERKLSLYEAKSLSEMVLRRMASEPVSQILGYKEFWSLKFEVTSDVLTPRPDSETVIEAIMKHIKKPTDPLRVLDLGTGSGCLLLALLSECPNAEGVGVDIEKSAALLAQRNAERLSLNHRSAFVVSDWGESVNSKFDIIISNPPYISTSQVNNLSPEVALYEPRCALDGGLDGLDSYRILFPFTKSALVSGGLAFFEISYDQQAVIKTLAKAYGLGFLGFQSDIAGIARVAILRQL
jgi:release factor glutamine methyltransferase